MEVQARWNNLDYTVRDEWNIQPQGRAAPVVTETVKGWEAGASVSVGKDGVSGSLSGKLIYKEGVISTEQDVELTNSRQDNWMVWSYRMGNQAYFTGSWGKVSGPEVPQNATSRSLSYHRQSWDWVVKETKLRANNPFVFDFKVTKMDAQVAWANSYTLETKKGAEVFSADMTDRSASFSLTLPSPERYRHEYTMTVDEIEDTYEFNSLMDALERISSKYKPLYNKLIRTDSEGNPVGRTGGNYEALRRMVGLEWYELAKEMQGKKINVSKSYKLYVKDEEGSKLSMIKLDKGEYKQVGTYLVISPDGIGIEKEEDNGDFDSGKIFTYSVNGYDLTFQVRKKNENCTLIGIPEDYNGALAIPSAVYGLDVVEMDRNIKMYMGGVTSLSIPGTIWHIDPYMFSDTNITELVLQRGVRSFMAYSFGRCKKLRTIILPATLYSLGVFAFSGCPDIREIHCEGTVPPAYQEGYPVDDMFRLFDQSVYDNAKLYVPKGCRKAYQNTIPWGHFKNIFESGEE